MITKNQLETAIEDEEVEEHTGATEEEVEAEEEKEEGAEKEEE